ncbi:MAG: tryptophan synthase subunit alpha [Candidatus Micrarchaeota archaeon]|nr:tryptophan synthase subunit alpha [Candidatus Micrarchaeota archaeon]
MGLKNIQNTFAQKKGTAFMPFLVAGYPDFETSVKITKILVENGADALEVGIPFSDPLADGPTIQAADVKAIENGMTPVKAFRLVKEIRKFSKVPIVIMCYANAITTFPGDFYKEAAKNGVDGVLVADVCLEEIKPFAQKAKINGLANVMIISPNTSLNRIKQIGKQSSGFLYVVSVMGVTGERKDAMKTAIALALRAKKATRLPTCIGFGISTPAQVKQLRSNHVDGAIVGSALIAKIRDKNYKALKVLAKQMNIEAKK